MSARFGEGKHAKLLAPLLKNQTTCLTCQRGKECYTTQLRDAALAAIIHLSGEKVSDYGFPMAPTNQQKFPIAYMLGFANDATRKEAIDKWNNRTPPTPTLDKPDDK